MPEMFLILLAIPFGLLFLGLLVWSLVWAYKDAEARGKEGWLAVLVVLFLNWPFSLLVWLLFRPDLPAGQS